MEILIVILLVILILLVLIFGIKISFKPGTENNSGSVSELFYAQDKIGRYQSERLNKMDSRLEHMSSDMNSRLERLSHSMGEMQSLASGVEDLKRTLSNVKTRGIMGEWQLGALISEIMSPEQYSTNIVTVPGTRNPVEFAIKLPGQNNKVYIPIDSKFPLEPYYSLLDAYDMGDVSEIDECAKALLKRVELFAKDIKTKYIAPPYTTDFGILFVPVEGLYAELIKRGMCETLQTKYKIVLAGPSTLAALLNSLQIGFKTLAVNEKAEDIGKQLSAIKTEFEKFDAVLQKALRHIQLAESDIDELIGTRTRTIMRVLDKIEK